MHQTGVFTTSFQHLRHDRFLADVALGDVLDRFAHRVNPLLRDELKGYRYYWATHQAEFATDILFTSRPALRELYVRLLRHATLCLRAEDVLTFLGRKLHGKFAGEILNDWKRRWPGARVKHWMKGNWIKMYDKHGCVLRIETTINDVSFFKHHRKVEHRQGPPTRVLAPVKKTIYSLIDLREIMLGCNRRYLAHLAALDDFSAGVRALDRLTKPRTVEQKTLKGINFFDPVDHALLHALQNPRVNIAGIRRADLLPLLDQLSPDRLSRQLRRLRDLGVIKRVAGTYRYYLTRIGRAATAALCRVTQTVIIPALA